MKSYNLDYMVICYNLRINLKNKAYINLLKSNNNITQGRKKANLIFLNSKDHSMQFDYNIVLWLNSPGS